MNPLANRFTGIFSAFGPIPRRPHDPDVCVWAATVVPSMPGKEGLAAGGAGWDAESAEGACLGEAIERRQASFLPGDQVVEASFAEWPLDEPAIAPESWVLFHPEQYATANFPFEPLTRTTRCRWVCCREATSGDPFWVPEEMVYLFAKQGRHHRFGPGLSTGLSCGRVGDPVLLRGLQEVIERDALVGAWWGRYPLEVWSDTEMFALLGEDIAARVTRPNLRYRWLRIVSPLGDHVVMVTLEGEDREGWCFSVGSACRETLRQAWAKALLEAIHGRYYVRHLLGQRRDTSWKGRIPQDFADHAVYYSLHPEAIAQTVLTSAKRNRDNATVGANRETLNDYRVRLGPQRPPLFRCLTPPGIAAQYRTWHVLKVVVPGLQPLHGNHALAHLGGPLWTPRTLYDYEASMPPHPFP